MTDLQTPRWIGDLETNGLLGHDPWIPKADTVWMFAAFDTDSSKMYLFVNDDYLDASVKDYVSTYKLPAKLWTKYSKPEGAGVKLLPMSKLQKYLGKLCKKGHQLCMHNMIKYDRIILKDLLDINMPLKNCMDTLILSKLSYPDRFPGHGLEAWGEKFGVPKPEHSQWDRFSLDMIHRLLQDVCINVLTWHEIHKELTNPLEASLGVDWTEAIDLEHKAAAIIAESEALGFPFDKELALQVYDTMSKHRDKLDEEIGFDRTYLTVRYGAAVSPKNFGKVFGKVCDLNFKEWGHFLSSIETEDDMRGYGSPVTGIFKKDGTYQSRILSYWLSEPIKGAVGPYCDLTTKEVLPDIAGPYTRLDYESVNPGSTQQLVRMLKMHGWVPDEWTEKGRPRITESSLEVFAKEHPEFENLKDRIVTTARMTILENAKDEKKGLINLVREDGTISSQNDQIGANTHRSRHRGIVNMPKVGVRWGAAFREIFNAGSCEDKECSFTFKKPCFDEQWNPIEDSDGNIKHESVTLQGKEALVGCDAQALEARILAALMGDENFINEVLNGDIHTVFWDTVRDFFSSRTKLKGGEYAFIFGAAPPKLGSIADIGKGVITESKARKARWKKLPNNMWTDNYRIKKGMEPIPFNEVQNAEVGKIIAQRFMKGLPTLGNLVDKLKSFAKEYGFIMGLDGRRFKVRKSHAVLNLKIQSTGAVIMKRALVMAYSRCYKEGIPFKLRTAQHDEFQCSCHPKYAERLGKILKQSIVDAGKYYKLKCPMDGEYKIAYTWAGTH